MFAVTSIPCFEIWILLHFSYSTAPFTAVGDQSACQRALNEVRRHFPEYAKNLKDMYDKLADKTSTALTHAGRLTKHNKTSRSSNPATAVHELVGYLRGLKSEA